MKEYQGRIMSLIEGGNQKGSFLSVQTRSGREHISFLTVPAGVNGVQWGRVAKWIENATKEILFQPRPGIRHLPGKTIQINTLNQGLPTSVLASNPNQSHLQALGRGTQAISAELIMTGMNVEGVHLTSGGLKERVLMLERDLAELRCRLLAPAAAINTKQSRKKMKDSRQIDIDPTAEIHSQSEPILKLDDAVMSVNRNSEIDTSGSISGTEFLDLDHRINTLLENDLKGPDGIWIAKNPDSICAIRRVCKNIMKELIDSGVLGDGKRQTKMAGEAMESSTEEDVGEIGKKDTLSNSQAIHCLLIEDSVDSTDSIDRVDMTEGKEEEMTLVEWIEEDETLVHVASGLRYCPKWNYYFSWVSNEDDDLRLLYYKFVNGVPTII